MIRPILLFLIFSSILSCQSSQDHTFEKLSTNLQKKMDQDPLIYAFLEKKLLVDSNLVVPQPEAVQEVLNYSNDQLKKLNVIKKDKLDISLHEQYDHLQNSLNNLIKNIQEDQIHVKDPAFYSSLPYLKSLVRFNNSKDFTEGFNKLSLHFQTAIDNLKKPDSEKLDSAISEGIAGYEFLDSEIKTHLISLKLEKNNEQILLDQLTDTQLKIKNYIAFCNSQLFEAQN